MDAGHITTGGVGLRHMADDLLEVQLRRVDDFGVWRSTSDDLGRHQRARIETYGTPFDEPPAAEGEKVRIAGASTDEIDSHASSLRAKAIVTRSLRNLGMMSEVVFAASMAAGSATPTTPILVRT